MKRLPFTVYGIIGYSAPGVATMWLAIALLNRVQVYTDLGIHITDILIFNNTFLDNAAIGIVCRRSCHQLFIGIFHRWIVCIDMVIARHAPLPIGIKIVLPNIRTDQTINMTTDQKVARRGFVVSGRRRRGVLHSIEAPFDAVSARVDEPIDRDPAISVFPGRDDGAAARCLHVIADDVGVIAPVGERNRRPP